MISIFAPQRSTSPPQLQESSQHATLEIKAFTTCSVCSSLAGGVRGLLPLPPVRLRRLPHQMAQGDPLHGRLSGTRTISCVLRIAVNKGVRVPRDRAGRFPHMHAWLESGPAVTYSETIGIIGPPVEQPLL